MLVPPHAIAKDTIAPIHFRFIGGDLDARKRHGNTIFALSVQIYLEVSYGTDSLEAAAQNIERVAAHRAGRPFDLLPEVEIDIFSGPQLFTDENVSANSGLAEDYSANRRLSQNLGISPQIRKAQLVRAEGKNLLVHGATLSRGGDAPVSSCQHRTMGVDEREQRVERYPTGAMKSEIEFMDGEPHGSFRSWHPNGALQLEVPYVRGRRHGTLRAWYETDQPESIREYANGKKHGRFTDWHPNGVKAAEGEYQNDELVWQREWDERGEDIAITEG